MSALAPPAALALAVRLLEARGFCVSARNERGDSVYLRRSHGRDDPEPSSHPHPHPESPERSGGLEGALQKASRSLEGSFEAAGAAPQDEGEGGRIGGAGAPAPTLAGQNRVGDAGLAIRVSNHTHTAKQRRKHPEVATSLVIQAPKTPAQVAAMVEATMRNSEARQRVIDWRTGKDQRDDRNV